MKKHNNLLKGLLTLILFSSSYFLYAQYPAVSHSGGPCEWSSISTVIIEDENNTEVYNKLDLCSGTKATNYRTLFGSVGSPIVTLKQCGAYTIKVNTTTTATYSWAHKTSSVGVWADFNDDKDFDDPGEWLSDASWNASVPNGILSSRPDETQSLTFTIPDGAASSFVIRIRSGQFGNSITQKSAGGDLTDGETEDFLVEQISFTAVNFLKPDSAFLNVPVEFLNSNRSSAISHNWTIDGIKYTKRDVTHVFKNAGTYDVELSSEICEGVNSISKPIKIVSPTSPPVVDFVSYRSDYEIFETMQLIDLSSGGATYWSWMFVNPTSNDTIDGDDIAELRGGDFSVNKNPQLFTGNYFGTLPLGVWDVYLTASNVSGDSTLKKEKYVTVRKPGYNIGAETLLPANVIEASAGTIYDEGGPTVNYGNNKTSEALISPCGAQSVTLEFTSFDLLSNATLKIYEGVNALGTPLHTGNGFTQGNAPTGPITASSGSLYMLWTSTTGTTASGFAANGKVNNGRFSVNHQGNTNGMYYVKMSLNGAIITKKIILNN